MYWVHILFPLFGTRSEVFFYRDTQTNIEHHTHENAQSSMHSSRRRQSVHNSGFEHRKNVDDNQKYNLHFDFTLVMSFWIPLVLKILNFGGAALICNKNENKIKNNTKVKRKNPEKSKPWKRIKKVVSYLGSRPQHICYVFRLNVLCAKRIRMAITSTDTDFSFVSFRFDSSDRLTIRLPVYSFRSYEPNNDTPRIHLRLRQKQKWKEKKNHSNNNIVQWAIHTHT